MEDEKKLTHAGNPHFTMGHAPYVMERQSQNTTDINFKSRRFRDIKRKKKKKTGSMERVEKWKKISFR